MLDDRFSWSLRELKFDSRMSISMRIGVSLNSGSSWSPIKRETDFLIEFRENASMSRCFSSKAFSFSFCSLSHYFSEQENKRQRRDFCLVLSIRNIRLTDSEHFDSTLTNKKKRLLPFFFLFRTVKKKKENEQFAQSSSLLRTEKVSTERNAISRRRSNEFDEQHEKVPKSKGRKCSGAEDFRRPKRRRNFDWRRIETIERHSNVFFENRRFERFHQDSESSNSKFFFLVGLDRRNRKREFLSTGELCRVSSRNAARFHREKSEKIVDLFDIFSRKVERTLSDLQTSTNENEFGVGQLDETPAKFTVDFSKSFRVEFQRRKG